VKWQITPMLHTLLVLLLDLHYSLALNAFHQPVFDTNLADCSSEHCVSPSPSEHMRIYINCLFRALFGVLIVMNVWQVCLITVCPSESY